MITTKLPEQPTAAGASTEAITRHYRFHDRFQLTLRSALPKVLRHFQQEYPSFAAGGELLGPPDLEVSVEPSGPLPAGQVCRFGGYGLTDEWIFGKARHKVALWRFAMDSLEQPTTHLGFSGGPFALDFLHHRYVEPIMRFKLARRGIVMVHGGCVAEGGASVLFAGLGHSGKTALALRQVLAGRQFQADDYTFLSAEGESYAYPRRLHISSHMYAACPAAMRRLSAGHRASIAAKRLILALTLGYGSLEEAVQLCELVPEAQTADVARLGAALLLSGYTGAEVGAPQAIGRDELASRVAAINSQENLPFQDLMLAHQFFYGTPAAEWAARETELLGQALAGVPCYEVQVPRSPRDRGAAIERLARIVDDMLE